MATVKTDKGVTIRPMKEEDVNDLLSINDRIQDRAITYDPVPDSCIGGDIKASIVAERDGEVVGFVLGRIAPSQFELDDVAWVEMIGILPPYRGKGLGAQLVESWKKHCQEKGISKVYVMVNQRDTRLQKLFESHGFSRGELVNYGANIRPGS